MILASSGFPLKRCCIRCSPKLTGMFVVFLTVDDLHLLCVLGFGCVARLYIDINKLCHGLGYGIIGVNRPAIVREIPHFGLFPAFPHFCENVPHF